MIQLYRLILLLAVFGAGCDYPTHYWSAPPPCVSEALPTALAPSEVRDRLAGTEPSAYRYFFRSFDRSADPIRMVVNFRNAQTCFDVELRVPELGPLAAMYAAGPASFPEELYDLIWRVDTVDGVDRVIFEDMHPIID